MHARSWSLEASRPVLLGIGWTIGSEIESHAAPPLWATDAEMLPTPQATSDTVLFHPPRLREARQQWIDYQRPTRARPAPRPRAERP